MANYINFRFFVVPEIGRSGNVCVAAYLCWVISSRTLFEKYHQLFRAHPLPRTFLPGLCRRAQMWALVAQLCLKCCKANNTSLLMFSLSCPLGWQFCSFSLFGLFVTCSKPCLWWCWKAEKGFPPRPILASSFIRSLFFGKTWQHTERYGS